MYVDKDYDKTAEGYFDPSIEVEVSITRGNRGHETMYSHLCDDCTPEAIEKGFNEAKQELIYRCERYMSAIQAPTGNYCIEAIYSLHDPYGDEYLDSDTEEDFYWNGEHLGIIGLKL